MHAPSAKVETLQAGLYSALNGNYLFYSGGMVQPGCPKWGVRPGQGCVSVDERRSSFPLGEHAAIMLIVSRWIMFETPITASLAQLPGY